MDFHVAQQTPLVEESLATLHASVWSLFLMDALVCCERCPVGEALSTVAGVHSLFFMSLEVPVEVTGAAEALVTARTFERTLHLVSIPAVGLQVPYQCRLPTERTTTLSTHVLSVLHVAVLVLPLSYKGLEELSADQALVLASGLVCLLVPLQGLFEGETSSALRTEEGLLACVDALVGFQYRLELEALLTVLATKTSLYICKGLKDQLVVLRLDRVTRLNMLLDLRFF